MHNSHSLCSECVCVTYLPHMTHVPFAVSSECTCVTYVPCMTHVPMCYVWWTVSVLESLMYLMRWVVSMPVLLYLPADSSHLGVKLSRLLGSELVLEQGLAQSLQPAWRPSSEVNPHTLFNATVVNPTPLHYSMLQWWSEPNPHTLFNATVVNPTPLHYSMLQ